MSKRSKSLADELRAKEAAESAEKQEKDQAELVRAKKILRDDEILKREAPNVWARFCEEIQSQCDEFNAEPDATRKLAVNRNVLNRITVSYLDAENVTREMRVSFDSKAYTITFSGLYFPKTAPFRITVLPDESAPSIVNELGPIDTPLTVEYQFRALFGL